MLCTLYFKQPKTYFVLTKSPFSTDIGLTRMPHTFVKIYNLMNKEYKYCQSCSMPLKQNLNGGGTEANGSISTMYCSYCYENGKFTQPDWDVQQMRSFVKNYLKTEKKLPGFLASLFTMGIPKLERWKQSTK